MQQDKFYELLKNQTLLSENRLQELQELVTRFPYFQAGWVMYLKNLKETGDPGYGTVLKQTAILVPDRKKLYRVLHPETNKYIHSSYFNPDRQAPHGNHDMKPQENSPSGNLIEKFLSANPGPIKIEKQEQAKHNEEEDHTIINQSTAKNDEIITETLANIYVEQKKYASALEAFKKLRLKYPEKSIYFASRIEEMEKLKNI
jgi:hypothetical protein